MKKRINHKKLKLFISTVLKKAGLDEYSRRSVATGLYEASIRGVDSHGIKLLPDYFDFVKLCRENGIEVPIIPGLKPISTLKQLTILPHRFHLNIPNQLVKEVLKCKSNDDVRKVGIEWGRQQTKELIEFGAPCIHFYTMGRSDNVNQIVSSFS